jgi:hypothetical protein
LGNYEDRKFVFNSEALNHPHKYSSKQRITHMSRPLSTTIPNNPLTDEEEQDRQQFKAAFVKDYDIKSKSDLTMLDLASYEYVKGRRLQLQELTSGHIMGDIRWHPISELVRLLGMMDATRAAKLRSKQPVNEDTETMKDFLMSISEIPTRSNNHAK